MKKIFTLLSAVVMSIAVMAAAPVDHKKSMLTIRSQSYGDIRVVLDGRRFEPNDNAMMVRNLQAGYHTIRVYRQKTNGFYNIFGHRYELVYSSSVMVRPKTHVRIMIDRYGRAMVNERRIRGNSYEYGYDRDQNRDWNDDDRYNHRNDRDWDNDRNWNNNGWDDDDAFDFDRGSKMGDYNDRNNGGFDYNRAINDREFNQVLSAIQKEWYEGNKLKSAQQIINTNFFTSVQVKQMLQLFTFENNKLDLAKLAYAKTVDQRSFLMTVDDVFSFDASRDELARYIRSFR